MTNGRPPSESEKPNENRIIHEIDGIQEYDNKLPNWWLNTFYGTILFAAVYWFHYQTSGFGELPRAEYERELDTIAAVEAARIKAAGVMTPEALEALAKDKETVEQGQRVFTQTCVACHRQDGGGVVGPNLTDDFWIHGGAADKIFATIAQGVADKGMPAWAPQLGPDRTRAVAAYVVHMRGTNVPGGKAPQGNSEPRAVP